MLLQSQKLRGAIGIHRGLGLDEIELDLTQFNPGLIAIAGRNGSGKTTIMENLQPFRRLVSRDGSLYDHFQLKDSYRVLKFEHVGKQYESKILIDPMTSNSEAYLYCDGKPLNDGKVGTYDDALERVLGSEDLFFNSVFSSQRSAGIAGLKPAKMRELFAELLNHSKYAGYLETTKTLLQKEQITLATAQGEITTLMKQNDNLIGSKEEVQKLMYNKTETGEKIEHNETAFTTKSEELTKDRETLTTLKNNLEQERETRISIENKETELNELTTKYSQDLTNTNEQEKLKLAELGRNNQHDEINTLEHHKIVADEKAQIEDTELAAELRKLNADKNDAQEKISVFKILIERKQKILDNKLVIDEKLKQRKELTTTANELIISENTITTQINALHQEQLASNSILADLEKQLASTQNKISKLDAEFIQLGKDKKGLEISRDVELKQMQETINGIEDTPCTNEVGTGCRYLQDAYLLKDTYPGFEKDFEIKLKQISDSITEKAEELDQERISEKQAEEDIGKQKEYIRANFTDKLTELEVKTNQVKERIKEVAGKLAKINKDNWEKLSAEASEAQQEITGYNNEIQIKTILSDSIQKRLNDHAEKAGNIQTILNEKLQGLDNQINSIRELLKQQSDSIAEKYKNEKEDLKARKDEVEDRLSKEILECKSKISNELDEQIKYYIEKVNELEVYTNNLSIWLEENRNLRSELGHRIEEMNKDLFQKQLNEDTINSKDAEIKFVEREIADYTFLQRAFDKTGIPVLKLENSSIEVTKYVNELLQFFDSNSRVVFDTVQWTKDKKKLKEVFDIQVVDDNGSTALKNKSGGEKVWLESALQLAISLVARSQGRKIQTAFLDEKDDGLDTSNADFYLSMIQKAHELSGVHHTMVITHKSALLERIPQQILLEGGELKVINTEVC